MAEIRFHPEARMEYEEAWSWYHVRSARAATRFEMEVERMLELVQLNPESFPQYDDEHRFCALRHYSYTLVYQIQTECINVVAVAQAGRAPGYWKGRA